MRRLILGTASVLALGIGGTALDYAADAGNNAVNAENMPAAFETAAGNLWKDDIRWAQLELRNIGLYHGSLDGVVGREMKRAIDQFQRNNGLSRTAMLDPQTFDALTGNPALAMGPVSRRTASAPNR